MTTTKGGYKLKNSWSQLIENGNIIACVHFGQPRKRSTGVTFKQRHLALGCSAKLTVSFDRK